MITEVHFLQMASLLRLEEVTILSNVQTTPQRIKENEEVQTKDKGILIQRN